MSHERGRTFVQNRETRYDTDYTSQSVSGGGTLAVRSHH